MAEKEQNQNEEFKVDWAQIIDLFASEYGWTIDEISKLNATQISLLIRAIRKRRRSDAKNISRGLMGVPSKGSSNLRQTELFFRKAGAKVEKNKDGKLDIKL